MKIIGINGSSRKDGNMAVLLRTMNPSVKIPELQKMGYFCNRTGFCLLKSDRKSAR